MMLTHIETSTIQKTMSGKTTNLRTRPVVVWKTMVWRIVMSGE